MQRDNACSVDATEPVLHGIIRKLLTYPHSLVCKHWAALQVLGGLSDLGYEITPALAQAIIDGDDYGALATLRP
jgi:hypothetical protein